MAESKNQMKAKDNTEAVAPIQALIAKAKKEGAIQATELVAQLEKLDLSVERIEQVYEQFDAMGIQIVGAELELDLDLGPDLLDDEEDLVDPVDRRQMFL